MENTHIVVHYSEYSKDIKGVYANIDNDFQAILINSMYCEEEREAIYKTLCDILNSGTYSLILLKADNTIITK